MSAIVALGLSGCVVTPNIDHSQQKVEKFTPVKRWIGVDVASIKDAPNGNERFKLSGGSEVYVFKYYDDWASLTPKTDEQQWINSGYLCDYAGCYTPSVSYKNPKMRVDNKQAIYTKKPSSSKSSNNNTSSSKSSNNNKSRTQNTSNSTRTQKTYSKTSNSSCYCTSGTYCVGPRGGHYCLNSTGTKRYLPR